MRYLLAVFCVASLSFMACGSDSSDSNSNTGGAGGGSPAGATGITSCGNFPDSVAKTCIAGQYCEDEKFSTCSSGCLSENNCTSAQFCDKSNGNVGACQTKPTTTTKDCAAFIKKGKACASPYSEAQLQQACDGLSTACVACVNDANCTDSNACKSECGQ